MHQIGVALLNRPYQLEIGGADSRPPSTSAVPLDSVKFLLLYVNLQYNCSSGDNCALI